MSEDWAAVARAVDQRMTELGISQRELVNRSNLSKAIVREIQHNIVQRRRSKRTMEALSIALDWHPGHLAAVLRTHHPPQIGEPQVRNEEDVPDRLSVIEHNLRELTDKVSGMAEVSRQLDQISANVEAVLARVSAPSHDKDD